MKQDKFLIGILIGIVVLVVVAVVVVMSRAPGSEQYLPDDTPDGVAHNYFLAMQRKEYEKAYAYLSDELKGKPDFDQFMIDVAHNGRQEAALRITNVHQSEQHATVELSVTTYGSGDIFSSNRYSTTDSAILRLDKNGQWKLMQFPYPYWGWNWTEPPVQN
jgi:hypothetical protein